MVIKNSLGDKRSSSSSSSSNNRSTVRRSSLPSNMDSNDSQRRSNTSLGIHDSRARPRSSKITNQSSNDKRQQQQQVSHSQYLNERRSSGMGSFQQHSNYPSIENDHWDEYDSYKLSKSEMERYNSNSYVMKSKEIYEKEKEKAIREACKLATDSRNRGNSGTMIRRSRKPVVPPRPSRTDVSRASQTA